jgi:putative ATP-dependent endonuclease of the OLD family
LKLREIRIINFRNLVDVNIPLGDTTVLVGENNSGKTAFLDALKIALTKSPSGKGSPFDAYDYHMSKTGDAPETSEGIIIELWFREDKPDEWSDSIVQDLTEIVQTDPIKDIDSIGLRLSSKYDDLAKQVLANWEFLAINGQPLGGKGANQNNLYKFHNYIRLFYLSALRDSNDEFSSRSQYWGRILRDLKISEEQRKALIEEIAKLNDSLLKSDPRLEQVRSSLDKVQKIMSQGVGQMTSIQALPLKPWDLMSKSELVIKAHGSDIEFPLHRHGQGMQSLSVLFLFQAYIDVLLKPSFKPETEAILTLEEPEAHLHPQATRALAASLSEVTSQKIISSHSPYFIQEIPFAQIKMFRKNGTKTKILYAKRNYTIDLPNVPEILEFCKNNSSTFSYDEATSTLIVHNKIQEKEYRELLTIYSAKKEVHPEVKRIFIESQFYLSDKDLANLDTYAKRIRGEVLFARAWFLCEGQSEYLLFRYFSNLLGCPLDNFGITLIDFQNNGSPGVFICLARAFEIPWLLICDNDQGGKDIIKQIPGQGILEEELKKIVRCLPIEGADIEMYLLKNGFSTEYMQIMSDKGIKLSRQQGEIGFVDEILAIIREHKIEYMSALIEKLCGAKADSSRVPEFLKTAIKDIIAMTK